MGVINKFVRAGYYTIILTFIVVFLNFAGINVIKETIATWPGIIFAFLLMLVYTFLFAREEAEA